MLSRPKNYGNSGASYANSDLIYRITYIVGKSQKDQVMDKKLRVKNSFFSLFNKNISYG